MSFLIPALQSIQFVVPDAEAFPEGSATHMATEELVSEHRPLSTGRRLPSHTLHDEQELEDEVIDIII